MKPRVSIIIATYRAEATIRRTLDSLLQQHLAAWEALIVDDASPDRSAAIAAEYASRDPRFRLVPRPANGGPAAARNTGISHARAEFLHFLDPDDWLLPDALSTLVDAAARAPHGAAVAASTYADQHGRALPWSVARPPADGMGLLELLRGYSPAIHAQVIRRDTLADDRFDETLRSIEDYDLFCRLALRGIRWMAVPQPVCVYRLQPRRRATGDFLTRAADLLTVCNRTFAHAAAAGILPDSVCGPAALAERCRRIAFEWASLMIADDPTPRKDHAAHVIRAVCTGPAHLAAAEAAAAAHAAVPFSLGLDQSAWLADPRPLAQAVGAWWGRCAAETWLPAADARNALRLLASHIAQDLAEPLDEVVAACRRAPRVVLLGLGRNGRRIAQRLALERIPFAVGDDALTPAQVDALLPGVPHGHVHLAPPLPAGTLHVMTVMDDLPFLRRLAHRGCELAGPAPAGILRFRTLVDQLAPRVEASLHPVFQRSALPAEAAA